MTTNRARARLSTDTVCAVLAVTTVPAGAVPEASSPTFEKARSYAVEGEPSSVAAADFDGDCRVDLAVENFSDARISVPTNRGDDVLRGTLGKDTICGLSGTTRWPGVRVGTC